MNRQPKPTVRKLLTSAPPTAEEAVRLIRAALNSVDDTLSANEAINIITGVCSRYNARLTPFPGTDAAARDFLSGEFARPRHAARRPARRM